MSSLLITTFVVLECGINSRVTTETYKNEQSKKKKSSKCEREIYSTTKMIITVVIIISRRRLIAGEKRDERWRKLVA